MQKYVTALGKYLALFYGKDEVSEATKMAMNRVIDGLARFYSDEIAARATRMSEIGAGIVSHKNRYAEINRCLAQCRVATVDACVAAYA